MRAPLGSYPARVDEKGRLKLPVSFQEYLNKLDKPRLFATSLDRRTAQIYTISGWQDTAAKMQDADGDNARRVKRVLFNAQDLGAECEMDGSGRVLLSPELRRTLGIENQPVFVQGVKGHIEVMSEAVYAQLRELASQTAVEDVEALEMARLL